MRFCIMATHGQDTNAINMAVQNAGGQNISIVPRFGQVFADLTDPQAATLTADGYSVKVMKTHKTGQMALPVVREGGAVLQEVIPLSAGFNVTDVFEEFRAAFTPALTGTGLTVAVLDSGIRTTHEALVDKVITELNFSTSLVNTDVFGHGTSVAYLIAGGTHGSRNTGIAPGAKLINIKVLNDDGEGTDEMLINGIDAVCDLVDAAILAGKLPWDDTYPNVINISAGATDDGDPDNPVRIACRIAVNNHGLQIIAAAGNAGPDASTIMIPATDPQVIAVGGLMSDDFVIWDNSSRGPAKDGTIKPDFVLYASEIYMADKASDSAYIIKSGTSFAAPIASGIIGLLWELGRRSFGQDWSVSWYDVEIVAPAVCVKPKDAPVAKDNTFGYGMPGLSAMIKGAMTAPAAAFDISAIMPVMMMGMMMGIMMPMFKNQD